ncbi:TRAP transporter large permease subunit, partial [Desertibacillus haloalkaliphilus]|nr:TRAP transporter large permease subunit [Desertibacillus haloalkaliphilus]
MMSLKGIGPFAILVFTIVAGLYSGIFTPTEAGGMGAFVVFVMVLLKHGFKWEIMKNSMIETMKTTCMIFILVGGAFVFSYFLSVSRIPTTLSQFLVSLPVEPIVIILGIILLYLILGMFIEMISAMFLTLPIIFPAVIALG